MEGLLSKGTTLSSFLKEEEKMVKKHTIFAIGRTNLQNCICSLALDSLTSHCWLSSVINRPGVAGAVLQTPL